MNPPSKTPETDEFERVIRAKNAYLGYSAFEVAVDHARDMEIERDEARAALEFYANPSDYMPPFTGGLGRLYFDCGEKARSILSKIKSPT